MTGTKASQTDEEPEAAKHIRRTLANHSVGFLNLLPGTVKPLGSGTLVRIGRVHGIITAAHVWHNITEERELSEIGFYQYPVRRREIQNKKEHTSHLQALTIGQVPFSSSGPDVAFLKLAPLKAIELEVHGSFLNLIKSREIAFMPPPAESFFVDAITGLVAEWGQKVTGDESRKTIMFDGLLNIGRAIPIENGCDGFDRLSFTSMPELGFRLPTTYRGTSGGGCFRTYVQGMKAVSTHFLGVAFYETGGDTQSNKIICHGPTSIYEKLWAKVEERWKEEI